MGGNYDMVIPLETHDGPRSTQYHCPQRKLPDICIFNPIPGGYFMYVGRGGGAKLP